MYTKLDKKKLVKLLERAVAVIDQRSPTPVLHNILVEASEVALTISAMSITQSICGTLDAADCKRGSFLVEGKRLLDRIRSMPDGAIRLSHDAERNELTIRGEKHSRKFQLLTIPADNFPKFATPDSEAKSIELSSTVLATLIEAALPAISRETERIGISSLLVEFEKDTLRAVSTDGHRLAKAEATIPVGKRAPVLIPLAGVQQIKAILSGPGRDVRLHFNGNWIFVEDGTVRFGARLVDAQYPPWEQVVPKDGGHIASAMISRDGLVESLRAIGGVTGRSKGAKLTVGGGLIVVDGENPDEGSATDSLDAKTTGSITIGASAQYAIELLTVMPCETVELRFTGELDPIVIVPAVESDGLEFLALVMPMRI